MVKVEGRKILAERTFNSDRRLSPAPAPHGVSLCSGSFADRLLVFSIVLSALVSVTTPLGARSKDKVAYGEGLIVNIPMPIAQVEAVIEDVADNGVIRGTKEYNKDQYVAGATAGDSPHVFPPWKEGGRVFYKVRMQALDPLNFKDTNDVGTLEVRYVLQPQGQKNTVLRIDALFKEDFRHVVHQSNGSVELAEYKDIREHLDAIEAMKKQDAEARLERQEKIAKNQSRDSQGGSSSSNTAQPVAQSVSTGADSSSSGPMRVAVPYSAEVASNPDASSANPPLTLEQQVEQLRRQVERVVKSPGAPLKSAPFHTAGTLQLLGTGTEVLIVIDTPYWYGVETHEGQHGWIMRDELEQKP
jgi:hypothetical protein